MSKIMIGLQQDGTIEAYSINEKNERVSLFKNLAHSVDIVIQDGSISTFQPQLLKPKEERDILLSKLQNGFK